MDFNKWKDEDDSEDEFGGGGQSEDLEEVKQIPFISTSSKKCYISITIFYSKSCA